MKDLSISEGVLRFKRRKTVVGVGKDSQEEDKKVLRAIRGIIRRGNDAEVRADKDGTIKVFEVKKHIVKAE